MPRKVPQKSKGPRTEHPRLVGISEAENTILERAATSAEMKPAAYIREAALYHAREELGLKHPAGGGK